MEENKPYTDREIQLIEEYGILKRKLEIQELFMTSLVARLGGSAVIKHDELEFARKNYILTQNVSWDDRTVDAKFSVRLK